MLFCDVGETFRHTPHLIWSSQGPALRQTRSKTWYYFPWLSLHRIGVGKTDLDGWRQWGKPVQERASRKKKQISCLSNTQELGREWWIWEIHSAKGWALDTRSEKHHPPAGAQVVRFQRSLNVPCTCCTSFLTSASSSPKCLIIRSERMLSTINSDKKHSSCPQAASYAVTSSFFTEDKQALMIECNKR